jgi:pimeloyl-ACP methyl ester carboxylesterase
MTERSLLFGADQGLIGTVNIPHRPEIYRSLGVVLFNAGVVHRVGPHRINVQVARRLAGYGIPSLRFDLAGHGDSARPRGTRDFEEQAIVDLRAAMDTLGTAASVERFAIFGICSGAYYAYACARRDERVAGIFMFDAYGYPTIKTHLYRSWKRLREPQVLHALFGALRRAIQSQLRGNQSRSPEEPELGRIDYVPTREEFAKGLKELLSRSVKIRMAYSGGDLRTYNYHDQFHDALAPFGIGSEVSVDFLPELDHVVTPMSARAALVERVASWCRGLTEAGEAIGVGQPAHGRPESGNQLSDRQHAT